MTLADALIGECLVAGVIALVLWVMDRRRGRPVEARSTRARSDFFGNG